MSSTCPYMLAKTSQLVTAARITSQNEHFKEGLTSNMIVQKLSKISTNLKTLKIESSGYFRPPRLSLKDVCGVASNICHQIKEQKLLDLFPEGSVHETYYNIDFEEKGSLNEDTSGCNDSLSVQNKNILCEKTEKYFAQYGISEDELHSCAKEIKNMKTNRWLLEQNEHKTEEGWVKFLQQKDLLVWRRPLNKDGLYQYKVFGTFFDISSEAFFKSQIDLQYRKSWDKYAISLDIIDKSSECGSEVVHWVTKFPYPLKSRDYVFVRRAQIDDLSNTMVLVSRASSHEECPESEEYIRVKDYASQMVVRPHGAFHQPGFDYVLIYHDDSRVNVPKFCVNMITGSAVPDFVKTLHDAAANMKTL
ncbi:stAR-related lipid transfer protein 7, mitochondrial-like [Dendronephthya gigantea]|uniref:stAR-related lipid transfer protein 7, mitochondrial-like n=1 Tax=Dendronephthya gigantea TaxID=151771 RepID=UPI00106BB3FB|nr:stAR-related lipid transfer protein 7, mitochondrial-like [Dendronephthya gigantea]